MIPMQWSANVKIPYYGWFGRDGFSTELDARNYVAHMLRGARAQNLALLRPSYTSRAYTIKLHAMRFDD